MHTLGKELSVLARQKGFLEWECTCGGYPDCICEHTHRSMGYNPVVAEGLQTWLRDEKGIHIALFYAGGVGFRFTIEGMNNRMLVNYAPDLTHGVFPDYWDALEAALEYVLTIVI